MKFIVNSQQLLKQLQSLSGVLSSSNTMPIINCFHFHLEENSLTIKTTDLTTTLLARLTVETGHMDNPEEVAVPSKMLLDILKTFDDVPLTFDVNQSNYNIEIASGKGQYHLAGLDAATYPTMPVAESTSRVVMNSEALVNAINKTVFATSNDEMHQQMSGIYCEMTPDGVTFVATDAHKLVRYRRKDVSSDESTNFILPKKPIIIVKNILAGRKEETCGAVDLIPLGTRERYVCATADLSQMLGVHCTRNYLHIGGMTKYPRGSNSRFADTVFFRNFSELGVQFGKLFVVDKRALEKSILKR